MSGSLEAEHNEGLSELLPKEKKLAEDLRETYFLVGNLVGNISPFASTVILIEANELAETHVRMARHIKGYYKFLEKLVSFNDYTPFISAHLKVVMVIMAYHDMVRGPAREHYLQVGQGIINKLPPNILEAIVNANNGAEPVPGMA